MTRFHHIVVVPTCDVAVLRRFLSWHSDYVRELGFDAGRLDYAVIGGANRRVNRQLAQLVAGFRRSDSVIGSRVHFFGDGWKSRLKARLEKEGVPRFVTSFLGKRQVPALRNVGHLAARALAARQNLDVDRVLLHQADHDVLPAYVLSQEPATLRLLPFSWFDSAETIFKNHPEAAAVCGRYLGDPDQGILSVLRARQSDAGVRNASSADVGAVLEDPARARRVAEALSAGIDLDNPSAWVQVPHRDDFVNSYCTPLPSPHGGTMSFRLGRFGHAPPTPYRGDDLFHVRSLLNGNPRSVLVAPHRAAFHEKTPRGRHLFDEMRADFMDDLLGRLIEHQRGSAYASGPSWNLEDAVRKSASKVLASLPAEDVVRAERDALAAALSHPVSVSARKDLESAKASYGVFLARLRQARLFFARVSDDPREVVRTLNSDAARFDPLDRRLAREAPRMARVAAGMPVR